MYNGLLWVLETCILSKSLLLSLLLSLVIMQLFREVPFCILVCMIYAFWHTLWLFLSLNAATAIIAEHSYFIWKEQPSTSSKPIKMSFQTFFSSAAFQNIQNAIKELDEGHTDVAAAVVKIALDNRLCKFSIFQNEIVIPLPYNPLKPSKFHNTFPSWLLWTMYVFLCQSSCGLMVIFIIVSNYLHDQRDSTPSYLPICLFLGPHLVRSSVKGLSILYTPAMLYYSVTRGFNSFTLVECKANMLNSLVMSWNLYINVHANLGCGKTDN